ncbi:MAG: DUF2029 domain-containing protein [Hyphomicrobiales bacterium]|nr:DUF2029 domain-containing protein [Hyphomicrobiales bacterium]
MTAAAPTSLWPKGRIGSWLAVAALGAAAQAILWSVSEPTELFSDFYKAYFPAAERLWQDGPMPTWPTDDSAVVGFVNLPVLAWLFVPFAWLDDPAAGWWFLTFGLACVALAYRWMLRLGDFGVVAGAMLALSILASGPLVNSLREGNTTHVVLLLLVLALMAWRAGAHYWAGLALGLCALLKLPLLLFGAYVLLRGRWRMAAGGATAIGAAVLMSLVLFGLEINIGWYRNCIEPFVGGVVPAFNVQSIDGVLARVEFGPARLMEWTPLAPPFWHKIVRGIVLAALYGAVLAAIYRLTVRNAARRRFEHDALEFSIVLVLAVVTSPLAWTHYYLFLLLPWALYLGGRLALPHDATTRRLMGAGMLLASLPVVALPIESGALAEVAARTLVSAWTFGGLVVLACLLRGALLGDDASGVQATAT